MKSSLFDKLKPIWTEIDILYNLAGTFQQIINSIFQELLYKGVLANYMDNFIIPTKTKKKLEKHIIQFLKVAKKHNLCFK